MIFLCFYRLIKHKVFLFLNQGDLIKYSDYRLFY